MPTNRWRAQRKVTASLDEVFARVEVDRDGGCWHWIGDKNSHGYGRISLDGRQLGAHRFTYEIFNGSIPPGMHIDHMCRNRKCVNPSHLRVVTPRINAIENSLSQSAMNARKTCCTVCGGPYSVNQYGGGRHCYACHVRRQSALGRAKRAKRRETEVYDPSTRKWYPKEVGCAGP